MLKPHAMFIVAQSMYLGGGGREEGLEFEANFVGIIGILYACNLQ